MSLINKMLQDLESRRATLSGDAGTQHEIRSLPPQRDALPWAKFFLVAVLALVAGAAVWFLSGSQTQHAPAPAPAPIAAGPVAAPIASAPIAPAPATAPDTQAPAASPQPAEAPPPSPPAAAATLPQPPPAAPAAEKKIPAAPPPPAAAAKTRPAQEPAPVARKETPSSHKLTENRSSLKVATTLGKVPLTETQTAGDDVRIEKKVRMSTSRERAENEYRRALGMVNQGRVQEGMAVLRGALSEDAAHAGARLALFSLLIEQQRFEDAQALLEETLTRDPAQPQMASRLARLKLTRGDARGAEETLSRAAGAATDNPEYRALHAAVLQRLTFHKKAVMEYQAALRLVPQASVWWMGLGISLEADGRLPEARDAFQRARATGALTPELTEFVEQRLKRLQ